LKEGAYPALAVFAGNIPFELKGAGTRDNPYMITDANELGLICYRPMACYSLTADIDLSGITWSTAVVPWFSGSFNGNQFCVRSLKIIGADYLGFFGTMAPGAEVTNLRLEDVSIVGTGDYIGGLTGENDNGSISSSYVVGEIRADGSSIGGLVGRNDGSILSSYFTGTVSGKNLIGGLVGVNNYCSIRSSYSIGMVSGDYSVGGLVGFNDVGIIRSSYSACAVSGKNNIGGLVGQDLYGSISSSFWDKETSGLTHSAGGADGTIGRGGTPSRSGSIGLSTTQMQDINTYLDAGWDFVGETTNGTEDLWKFQAGTYPSLAAFSRMVPVELQGAGTLDDPYLITDVNELGSVWFHAMAHYRLAADIDLSNIDWCNAVVPWFGGSFDGNGFRILSLHIQGGVYLGLFGILVSGAEVTNLGLQDIFIEGIGDCIGGLAADNSGSISSSYCIGSVSGNDTIGGMVGNNSGSISSGFSTGTVSGKNTVGGLVGHNSGCISSSYSTGIVHGEEYIGGLIGDSHAGRVPDPGIIASFWDIETSGLTESPGGTGLVTAQMQDIDTYLDSGWDFVGETENGTDDIWWILEGQDYPRLWWEADDN